MKGCVCAESPEQVCPACIGRFERLLGDLPALLAELDVSRYERRRGGQVAGGRSKAVEPALPFDPTAGDLADEVRRELVSSAREVMRDLHMPEHWSDRTPYASLTFLLSNLDWFRDNPDRARPAIEWLAERTAKARRVILGPADRWFAGVCGAPLTPVVVDVDVSERFDGETVLVPYVQVGQRPTESCDARLFAELGRDTVRCKACGASYRVEDRRAELVAAAEQTLLPIDTILAGMPLLIGSPVNASTARNWRCDRKAVPARPAVEATEDEPARPARPARPFIPRMLHAHSLNLDGRELYWVGEVVKLAEIAQQRSAARISAAGS